MPGSPAPTHDLIRLREPIELTVDAPVPSWVEPVLRRTPWVVVRRGHVRDGMMPVGVRGMTRQQRFAAFLAVAEIADRLSPEDLAASPHVIERERKDAVPALAALARVATVLACRGQRWGPGGSIGFEIATGVAAATPSSDLDLILRQDQRLGPDEAVDLRAALAEAAARRGSTCCWRRRVAASRSRTSPRGQSKCSCARRKALVLRPIPGG